MLPGSVTPSFEHIVERINVGVVVVDADFRIVFWNRFMATHSGSEAETVVGRTLCEAFPQLPFRWLRHKLSSVLTLGTPSFSSWRQRPYLFPMAHNRTVTGSVDYMRQDCTFMPLSSGEGEGEFVGIFIVDVTETAVSQAALDEANQRLEEVSIRDALTGLYNRRHAEVTLTREVERTRRSGQPLTVVLFDVDHFKEVNDTHGHPAGDAVLKTLASALLEALREVDVVARFGGEEFLVMMPETDSEAATQAIRRLRRTVKSLCPEVDGTSIPFTVSGGVVVLEAGDQRQPEALIQAVDKALYTAKTSGRDRFILADSEQVLAGDGADRG